MSFHENDSNFHTEEKTTSEVNNLVHRQPLTSPSFSSSFSFSSSSSSSSSCSSISSFSSSRYGSYDVSDGDTIADINSDIYLLWYIDIPNKLMYHTYRNTMYSTETQKLLHIWPHRCLLAAIKNIDFNLFKEIIKDIINDILEKEIFHSYRVNPVYYVNPTLHDTYFNIVNRNGLTQFAKFLLSKDSKFNKMNNIHHNSYAAERFATEGKHIDTLADFLEQSVHLEKYQMNLDISLYIAVRRNDLICAYMLLIKGARADISHDEDITPLHLAALKGNVDMVRLILMVSQHPPNIDNYRDYYNRTTRNVIENLSGLSLDSNFFEELLIPPIKESTLKFFLNNSDETKCLKVMKEGFHEKLSRYVAEKFLNIATLRNYCKVVQELYILGKFCESPINLEVAKNRAVICGNHAVLRELLELQSEVTNDLIMDACRLLKISLREIDNMSDQLKNLKLILENMEVPCTDGGYLTKRNFLKRKDKFEDSNAKISDENDCKKKENSSETMNLEARQPSSASSASSSFKKTYTRQQLDFCLFNDWDIDYHLIKSMLYEIYQCKRTSNDDKMMITRMFEDQLYDTKKNEVFDSIQVLGDLFFRLHDLSLTFHEFSKDTLHSDNRLRKNEEELREFNRMTLCSHITGEHVDILASLLEQPTISPNFEKVLNNALYTVVKINDQICTYMLLCKGASASDPTIDNMTALHLAARNYNVDMVRLILMASQQPPDIDSYRDDNNWTTREVIQSIPELSLDTNFFEYLHVPPIKEQTLKFFLNNSDETKCLKVMREGLRGEISVSTIEELINLAMRRNYWKIIQKILYKLRPTEVTNDLIVTACRLLKISLQEIDYTSNRLECLKLILEQKNMDVRCTDGRFTGIFQAIRRRITQLQCRLLRR